MTKTANAKHLAEVKQALADKYERLAKAAKSVVKRREFLHNAEKYRRQAEQLTSLQKS